MGAPRAQRAGGWDLQLYPDLRVNYTLTALKGDTIFSPGRRYYTPLSSNQSAQNFTGAASSSWAISTVWGLASNGEGHVYITSYTPGRLHKFSVDGTSLTSWATRTSPSGVAVGPDGSVYVVNVSTSWVVKYSPTGVSLTSWAMPSATYGWPPIEATGLRRQLHWNQVINTANGTTLSSGPWRPVPSECRDRGQRLCRGATTHDSKIRCERTPMG